MNFYVYIIKSELDYSYYKGFSENPLQRIAQHNNRASSYTAPKAPWTLIHIEIYKTKRDALVREKVLKKYSHQQLEILIASPKNQLIEYLNG